MRRPGRRFYLTVSSSSTAAVFAAAAAAAALLAGLRPGHAAPGDLDLTFGSSGTGRVQSPEGVGSIPGMAVQPDGKILLTGGGGSTGPMHMTLWRLNPDGSPDTSFNGTGHATVTGDLFRTRGAGVFVRGDGRIIFTGRATVGPVVFAIASLLPDGRPDLSFGPGGDGVVSFDSPAFVSSVVTVLQPDGKILVAGSSPTYPLMRLQPDGSPDLSFGTSGGSSHIPNTPCGPAAGTAFALQSDGKILLARDSGNFSVTRFHPHGIVDMSFGMFGTALVDELAGGYGTCRAVTALANGKVLAAGDYQGPEPGDTGFMLVQYLSGGTPDPAFGAAATPGRILLPAPPMYVNLAGMAVQSDGRILTAGITDGDLVIMRCTADGLPDNTFGVAGQVRTTYGAVGVPGTLLLPEDKLLVAGAVSWPDGPDNLMARYHAQVPVQLTVEHPSGLFLPRDPPGPVDFGPVTAGIRLIPLTLRNNGLNTLTNLQAVLRDETIPGDYHVNPPAAATLAPGAATTVVLSLTPSAAAGLRTATLRLTAGNVNPSLPPRLIPLTGSKATPLQIWRATWFGSPDNSGAGADENDFDGDGLPNFMEFATLSNPHTPSPPPLQPYFDKTGVFTGTYIYTRPVAAAAETEVRYQAEVAPSPAGQWSTDSLSSVSLTDDGTVQTMQIIPSLDDLAASRLFLRLRVRKVSDQ